MLTALPLDVRAGTHVTDNMDSQCMKYYEDVSMHNIFTSVCVRFRWPGSTVHDRGAGPGAWPRAGDQGSENTGEGK